MSIEIVDLPMKNGGSLHSYCQRLPEGTRIFHSQPTILGYRWPIPIPPRASRGPVAPPLLWPWPSAPRARAPWTWSVPRLRRLRQGGLAGR